MQDFEAIISNGIKTYIVGGYVRDRLLNRECKDHDFVIVGATPQQMLAFGFQKVGADFPVYLSSTGDEFALARTERKTSAGYNGFETDFNPTITLRDDLIRRDLTVNAMAREVIGWTEEGHAKLSDEVIDYFHGQYHLKKKLLKHVSKAFAEDPVRVLRVARFAARYSFDVAPATIKLMKSLVDDGELDHLVAERVWTELEKAVGDDEPSRFFWTLQKCGAFDVLFPELGKSLVSTGYNLRQAALLDLPIDDRLVIIFSGVPFDQAEILMTRLKSPSNIFRLTRKMRLLLDFVEKTKVTATEVLQLLNDMDAFNNSDNLKTLMFVALTCKIRNANQFSDILVAFKHAQHESFTSLSKTQQANLKGKEIGKAINTQRLSKIKDIFN